MARASGRLSAPFYSSGTVALARAMLGMRLVTVRRGKRVSGRIVEVEAYLGKNDPACHASRGMTPRNEVMFRAPGHCYVYLIYGMYHCVNVVSDPEGIGSAVLIRAVEPLEGVDVMARRRGISEERIRDLARGPGRLCEAFDIGKPLSGSHLVHSETIWLENGPAVAENTIGVSGRIGIRQGAEMPLRFFVLGSRFVSA